MTNRVDWALAAYGAARCGAAIILSASGTTAAPKGVVLGHAGTIRLARAVAERQHLGPDQRF